MEENFVKHALLEAGVSPFFSGAAGGVGGYLLGKYLSNPVFNWREAILRRLGKDTEEALTKLKYMRETTPLITAAVGAFMLATLAAQKAREDERQKIMEIAATGARPSMGVYPSDMRAFTPSQTDITY